MIEKKNVKGIHYLALVTLLSIMLLLNAPSAAAEPWHEGCGEPGEYGVIPIPIVVQPWVPPDIILPNLPIFQILTDFDYFLWTAHGGWWYDAEKTADNTDDDLMCWAASCSNALEWTGWGMVNDPTWGYLDNTDEIFQNFNYYWADSGGFMSNGWDWWFDGTVYGDLEITPSGNYYATETYTDYYDEEWDKALILPRIDSLLHSGYAVTIGIRPVTGSGGHAITCWGYRYDSTKDKLTETGEYYLGVWVSDSDDNKGSNTADPPPNTLRYYQVDYDSTNNRWEMIDYGNGWYIEAVMALAPRAGEARPVAEAGATYVGPEGTPVPFSGAGSTDDDSLQYRWDYDGDDQWDTAWSGSSTGTHTFVDEYSGKVLLEVYDGILKDVDQVSVTITNVAPTAEAGPSQTVDEGDTVSFSGSYTDPGSADTHTVEWSFGDGSPAQTGTLNPTHVYADNGVYTVTLTVTDDDGEAGSDSLTVTVSNVAPVVEAGPTRTAAEGETLTIQTITFNDKGTLDTHTATISWGDGTIESGEVSETPYGPPGSTAGADGTVSGSHAYGDDGTYTVTVTVTDDDGGSSQDTLIVTVTNVAPTVESLTTDQPNPQFILPGVHTIQFTATFADPGWLDTHTAEWNYGDGTVESATLTEENDDPDATGTCTGAHAYAAPGTYTVTITVTDDDGASDQETVEVRIVTVDEAIEDTNDYIQGLDGSAFKNSASQRKNALGNMFSAVLGKLESGDLKGAVNQLSSIMEKADGAGEDWITDPTAQGHVLMKIDDICAYLRTFI